MKCKTFFLLMAAAVLGACAPQTPAHNPTARFGPPKSALGGVSPTTGMGNSSGGESWHPGNASVRPGVKGFKGY